MKKIIAAAFLANLLASCSPALAQDLPKVTRGSEASPSLDEAEPQSAQLDALNAQMKLCSYLNKQAAQALKTLEADEADQTLYSNTPYREMLIAQDNEQLDSWSEKSATCARDLNQMWIAYNTSH